MGFIVTAAQNKPKPIQNILPQIGKRFIAGGDYNHKHRQWRSSPVNPKGQTPHNYTLIALCN